MTYMEDADMAMARWDDDAVPPAIERMRRGVTRFARLHGMSDDDQVELAVAVTEVVTSAVRSTGPCGGRLAVDAATDGEWLSVRVADHGDGAQLDVPLINGLADRTEFSTGNDGRGTVVLMEFPMGSQARGRGAARRAVARIDRAGHRHGGAAPRTRVTAGRVPRQRRPA
jgi:anti-sigma regulatory factor (Ser/Thr protein kinase)